MLENPEEIIAQVVLDQLRENWGGSVDFEKLLDAISRLAQQSRIADWGKE